MNTTQNLEVEIELTYLARELPKETEGIQPVAMLDVYIAGTSDHPHLRLRCKDGSYKITKKMPVHNGDSSYQTEQTIPLDANEFQALSVVSKKRIEKGRYAVVLNGQPAEVDVFKGELTGLVLIDFEFKSVEAKDSFEPPACCLAEVTQEEFIAGGLLADKTYKDIQPILAKFGYQPLAQ